MKFFRIILSSALTLSCFIAADEIKPVDLSRNASSPLDTQGIRINNTTNSTHDVQPAATTAATRAPQSRGSTGRPPEYYKYNWDVNDPIMYATGSLSLIGSLWIIADVIADKKKRQTTYHRLISALSFFDICASFFFATRGWAWSDIDSYASCTARGFLAFIGSIGVPMYNLALAIYFCLTIQHSWRNDRIVHDFERYVHPTILLFSGTLAIFAIPTQLYNEALLFCSPFNFRRAPFEVMRDAYFGVYCSIIFLSAVFVTVLMILLDCHVRKILRRSHRFRLFQHQDNVMVDTSSCSQSVRVSERRRRAPLFARNESSGRSDAAADSQRSSKRLLKPNCAMARNVRKMALLYTIPFYVTWVVPTLWHIIKTMMARGVISFSPSIRAFYVMQVYNATFMPLQGFFNWFIYMLARFERFWIKYAPCKKLGCKFKSGDNSETGTSGNTEDEEYREDEIGSIWEKSGEHLGGEDEEALIKEAEEEDREESVPEEGEKAKYAKEEKHAKGEEDSC